MYVSDFGAYPPSETFNPQIQYWSGLIEPYASGPAGNVVFMGALRACPSSQSLRGYGYNHTGVDSRYFSTPRLRADWGKYGLGGTGDELFFPYRPLPESRVLVPSDMISIGDIGLREATGYVIDLGDGIGFSPEGISAPPEIIQTRVNAARKRHGSKSNIVFCDGHVEGLKFTRLYANQESQLKRWNNDNQPHTNLISPTDFQP